MCTICRRFPQTTPCQWYRHLTDAERAELDRKQKAFVKAMVNAGKYDLYSDLPDRFETGVADLVCTECGHSGTWPHGSPESSF